MVKIFIDPGHGGRDSGASGNGLIEKNLTLAIAKAVKLELEHYTDVIVNMSRSSDQTVSLKERTDRANQWKADFFLSIHINAGGGTGFETYIYNRLPVTSSTAKRRGQIHHHVMKVNDLKDRGKKQANFHVLRETAMSAVLTENGFIDTQADASKLKQAAWIQKVGKAHAEGIAVIFKLRKKKLADHTSQEPQYTVTTELGGYYTAEDAKKGIRRKTIVHRGKYIVYKRAQGMINVTKQKGTPGSWINPEQQEITWKRGQKVILNTNARNYATGEKIPDWVKGRTYTVQQVKQGKVLLKEIYSWVNSTDLHGDE